MNFEEFMELNKIRILMDENLPKAKQLLSILLNKNEGFIHFEGD